MPSRRTDTDGPDGASTGLRAGKEIAKRVQDGVLYVCRVFPAIRNASFGRSSAATTTLLHRTVSTQRKKDLSEPHDFNPEPRLGPVNIAPGIRQLPPPPPPPMFSMPTSNNELHNLRYHSPPGSNRRLEEIEARFEELQDAKEDLTGTRFRLQRDRRNATQPIREKTGEVLGSALIQLQRFLGEEGITLPQPIQESFEQIHALRDQLGLREAEYDDAEQQYNNQEVRFTQKLSMFVDDLLNNLPPPLPEGSPGVFESQASGVANLISDNLNDWTVLESRDGDEYTAPVIRTPTTTYASGAASNRSTFLAEPATSASSTQRQSASGRDKFKTQDTTESGMRSRLPFDPKKDVWLPSVVSGSLQKTHPPHRHPLAELYEASWWEGTTTHCFLISFTGAQFHMDHPTALEDNASDLNMMSELGDIYYKIIEEQRLLLRSTFEGEWDFDNSTYSQAIPPASKPTGDVPPTPRRSQTGSTDSETIRSLSLGRKPLDKHTSRGTMETHTTVYCGPRVEPYGNQRRRRHTTAADARAVFEEELKDVRIANRTAHTRHYSDPFFLPGGDSVISRKGTVPFCAYRPKPADSLVTTEIVT